MGQLLRRLYFILISLSVLFSYENNFSNSGTGKISLQHSIEFTEINGGYTRLAKIGQGHTTEAGMPELPRFTTFYQLDPEKTYDFQLEVLESYTIENITILPHQGMEKWEVDNVNIINTEIYNSYAAFPEQNMVISERSQGRGIAFVSIQVTPYKYYPKYEKLEVFTDIDIHVIETGDNPNPQLTQPMRSLIFDEFYKDLIVNFEYSDRPEDYQAPAILYIAGGNWINNSYVQDLFEWRHKQGYIVYTYDTPTSNENTIKSYIKNAYETWENPPEIVGLIGDTDVIDCFYQSWGPGGWNSYNGATDFDFTQLDGDDLIPEVFIGRISGQQTSVMENVINKTIQYEKALYVDDDWFTKAALVGDPVESGNSTVFTNQYIENLMINHGMTDIATDYDGYGISSFVVNQFQDGILYYNYRGIYGDEGTGASSQFNNGYETPFVTTMTCGTGDYDNGNSQSEGFVKLGSVNNPEGAVAAVGISTTGTHTAYNNIVDMGIYDGIFAKKLWYAGASVANGDLAILATYPENPSDVTQTFIAWSNLIGDPALHLWTGKPDNFIVDHPATISLGTTTMEIIVYNSDGNLVENARVTLLMGEDVIFSTGVTDENGEITLNWDAVEAGNISIMAMKSDFRPYEGNIEIPESFGAAISIIPNQIYVNSGESNQFEIALHNYGNVESENVIAELSSLSEHVTITESINYFGNITAGSTVSKLYPVYIHGTAHDMEDLEFQLTISDELGNNWLNHLPVTISGPHLKVTDYNGEFLPGMDAEISINLANYGSRIAHGFTAELISIETDVAVNSSLINLDNIGVGNNLNSNGFDLSFHNDIINGSVFPMELLLTSSDGYSRVENFNITVGEVRESDPLGPDAYGYYIYDSEDEDSNYAPNFNWIELPDELGEQLPIYDNGNGNNYAGTYTNGSTLIDLPFIFTFYGIDYDQIVVNTNGWISFGDFLMYSFRNYPIPGAGGPSPMVAAFWDDLKTGGGGYVYYYETEEMVVIQWDDLRTYDNSGQYHETFEIILYNKDYFSPTITGDSEIKIQYGEFNNTSDGSYPNGGTPIHGCYSTIGIENHLGDIGLQYTFNNIYPEAAASLQDWTAIFITTGRQPRVHLSLENINLTNGTLDIRIENEDPVAGFQFEIFGISLMEISGGEAEANDFILSASSNMVLGFSTSGTVIPSGTHLLGQVSFTDYDGGEICFGSDPINNIISNIYGNSLQTEWGDCVSGSLMGDLNSDGSLDILDLVALANLILDEEFELNGDMNGDGQLNILDIVQLVNTILG
ncbi:MAG: hypothetical protein H8E85_01920 [Candidatus Marinimicrobia bacterium]|nr:hypothetical protein [Candidatus Neomarinimicrobiota bacterium]